MASSTFNVNTIEKFQRCFVLEFEYCLKEHKSSILVSARSLMQEVTDNNLLFDAYTHCKPTFKEIIEVSNRMQFIHLKSSYNKNVAYLSTPLYLCNM